jgi:CheY-like chemotaxis protein
MPRRVYGTPAAHQLSPGAFDAILMDVQMPVDGRFDGHETDPCEEAAKRADPIPILSLTATPWIDQLRLHLDAGVNRRITKPISQTS